jgi:hypothetical protein
MSQLQETQPLNQGPPIDLSLQSGNAGTLLNEQNSQNIAVIGSKPSDGGSESASGLALGVLVAAAVTIVILYLLLTKTKK